MYPFKMPANVIMPSIVQSECMLSIQCGFSLHFWFLEMHNMQTEIKMLESETNAISFPKFSCALSMFVRTGKIRFDEPRCIDFRTTQGFQRPPIPSGPVSESRYKVSFRITNELCLFKYSQSVMFVEVYMHNRTDVEWTLSPPRVQRWYTKTT